jgi:O-antigen/teichoic acid export membrane protein
MSRKIVQNAALFAAFGILQRSVGLLLLPLYTRYLTPAEYGIIGLTTSLSLPLGIFFNLGLNTAVVRFHFHEGNDGRDFERRLYSTLFVAITGITLLSTGVVLAISKPVFAPLIPGVPLYPYFYLALVPIALSPFYELQQRIWSAKQSGKDMVVLNALTLFIRVSFALVLVIYFKAGAFGILAASAVASVVTSGYAIVTLLRQYGVGFDKALFKECSAYSLPLIPNKFVGLANGFINNYIIGFFGNLAQVGLYSISNQFMAILTLLDQSVTEAIRPWCYQKFSSPEKEDKEKPVEALIFVSFATTFLATSASFFARPAVAIVLAPTYFELWKCVPLFLSVAVFNQVKNIWLMPLMYFKGGTRYAPIATYSYVALNLVFALAFVPKLGFVGGAMAMLFGRLLSSIVMMFFASRVLDFSVRRAALRAYAYPLWGLAASSAVFLPELQSFGASLLLLAGNTIVSYFVLARFYRPNPEVVAKLRALILRRGA